MEDAVLRRPRHIALEITGHLSLKVTVVRPAALTFKPPMASRKGSAISKHCRLGQRYDGYAYAVSQAPWRGGILNPGIFQIFPP